MGLVYNVVINVILVLIILIQMSAILVVIQIEDLLQIVTVWWDMLTMVPDPLVYNVTISV